MLEIVGNLRRNLSRQHPEETLLEWVSPRTIYLHPNIKAFSQLLRDFLDVGQAPVEDADSEQTRTVNELVDRFSSELPTTKQEATARHLLSKLHYMTTKLGCLKLGVSATDYATLRDAVPNAIA
ncbi:hypothetical protein HD806DRAFT_528654 [Xylariaceae sp. AK1471]|nr:hypothetical protein HD806DRAFT_528654 [Xylariaceae sp. AK1471]